MDCRQTAYWHTWYSRGCSKNTSVIHWMSEWSFSSKSSKHHESQTTCQVSCVMCHLDKLVKLVGRVSVVNGAYPVKFKTKTIFGCSSYKLFDTIQRLVFTMKKGLFPTGIPRLVSRILSRQSWCPAFCVMLAAQSLEGPVQYAGVLRVFWFSRQQQSES